MSQVLQYGFPNDQRLLCENPVCDALASSMAIVKDGPDKTKEICGCQEHITQLTIGRKIERYILLKTPGKRNVA